MGIPVAVRRILLGNLLMVVLGVFTWTGITYVVVQVFHESWVDFSLRFPPGRAQRVRATAEALLPPPVGLEFEEMRFRVSYRDPGFTECLAYRTYLPPSEVLSYYRTALATWQWPIEDRVPGLLAAEHSFIREVPFVHVPWSSSAVALRVDGVESLKGGGLPAPFLVCATSWDDVAHLRSRT